MAEPTTNTCPRCGSRVHLMDDGSISCVNGHNIPSSSDPVNHPPHYCAGEVECITAIKSALGAGFAAYCRGNALKYLWRLEHKGGLEDAQKAAWYCQRLVEALQCQS